MGIENIEVACGIEARSTIPSQLLLINNSDNDNNDYDNDNGNVQPRTLLFSISVFVEVINVFEKTPVNSY